MLSPTRRVSVPQWASVLSRVALEQERMLPVILDLLRTNNDPELRSLTGFLRNMSRHAKDKNDLCKSPWSYSSFAVFHSIVWMVTVILTSLVCLVQPQKW